MQMAQGVMRSGRVEVWWVGARRLRGRRNMRYITIVCSIINGGPRAQVALAPDPAKRLGEDCIPRGRPTNDRKNAIKVAL